MGKYNAGKLNAGRVTLVSVYQIVVAKKTIKTVIEKYGVGTECRFVYYFNDGEISCPSNKVKLFAINEAMHLYFYSLGGNRFKGIKDYYILAASDVVGPKPLEGDGYIFDSRVESQ